MCRCAYLLFKLGRSKGAFYKLYMSVDSQVVFITSLSGL